MRATDREYQTCIVQEITQRRIVEADDFIREYEMEVIDFGEKQVENWEEALETGQKMVGNAERNLTRLGLLYSGQLVLFNEKTPEGVSSSRAEFDSPSIPQGPPGPQLEGPKCEHTTECDCE